MNKDELLQTLPQQTFILAPAITREMSHLPKSRVPIATRMVPDRICGKAQLIGYTGTSKDALALYRIKVIVNNQYGHVTLPSLFVLVDDLFIDYQQWSHDMTALKF